jgi:presenilin-like A22 family membrane protease
MKVRTKLVLLVGALLGGVAGWLMYSWSIDRMDTAEGVGLILVGATYGFFIAVLILTGGTCDFRPQPPGGMGSDVGQP